MTKEEDEVKTNEDEGDEPEKEEPEKEEKEEKKSSKKKPVKKSSDKKPAMVKRPSPSSKKTAGYGIDFIAKELKKEPNVVRIMLRKNKIKKEGKTYSWPNKVAAEAVVKKLRVAAGK